VSTLAEIRNRLDPVIADPETIDAMLTVYYATGFAGSKPVDCHVRAPKYESAFDVAHECIQACYPRREVTVSDVQVTQGWDAKSIKPE
jgi:hypothetical protein